MKSRKPDDIEDQENNPFVANTTPSRATMPSLKSTAPKMSNAPKVSNSRKELEDEDYFLKGHDPALPKAERKTLPARQFVEPVAVKS